MWRDQAYLLDMQLAAADALSFAAGLDQASPGKRASFPEYQVCDQGMGHPLRENAPVPE